MTDSAAATGADGGELADALDRVVRSWDAYERARGTQPVIDFDCWPQPEDAEPVEAAPSRLDVIARLSELHDQADADAHPLAGVIGAHLAYLHALCGERPDLDTYVRATQGCPVAGWPAEHADLIENRARAALDALGILWGPNTSTDLAATEEALTVEEAKTRVVEVAAELEPALRKLTGVTAEFEVTVEVVDVDDYWAFWLDGVGSRARLRFNTRHATFTDVRLRVFAQHELLGHALQSAAFHDQAVTSGGRVDWPRLLAVHLPYQVMLEGLAQALPLFLTPDEDPVVTRVRLAHHEQLVRAELHQAINTGATLTECVDHAKARAPWWTDETIGDALTDRANDPLLRSYLWAYPAGADWFIALADNATDDTDTAGRVLRAAYERPLTPADLALLWPAGPTLGGPGAPLRLRKPSLP